MHPQPVVASTQLAKRAIPALQLTPPAGRGNRSAAHSPPYFLRATRYS
ncbi:hypothetical protein [Sulfuriroseicoccus oceanibius]|uniref:Uncharacterized protein n=1 Tax=Sulfuriroseicoccus oceanibius TaxID=2707525 RepID=A0A7T7F1M0_9BACT|nr:hypothetical protein [Sulfuriroseicoccus oceanibius]QQL45059.1 hypothetical protein G3M56_000280 [Sulfuriroseicoccus oceanibius]